MKQPFTLLEKASLFTIAAAALATLPAFLVPPGLSAEGDALDYRIPILKWMLRHGQYPNWPWTFVDDYPMLGELLILPFFALKAELVRLVPILAYAACALFTGLIGTELLPAEQKEKRRAFFLFAAASTLGLQTLLVQSNYVMVDNIAAAFALASLWLLLKGRIGAAGFAMACALATRYMIWGAFPGGLLAIAILGGEKRWKKMALFCGVAMLGAAPFLARNALLNGNPFFPLLSEIFNGVPLSAFSGWGRGRDLLSLLLFPWDLLYTNTFERELFDTRSYTGGHFVYKAGTLFYLQLGVLALTAVSAWAGLRAGARAALGNPKVQALLAFGLLHFLFWFYGSQQLRFLGCGMALASLLVLRAIFVHARPALLTALALLPLYNVAGVQSETWAIAFGRKESFRESGYVQSAFRCLGRAGLEPGSLVGFPNRDVTNGYFDYDFVFLPPNNLFINVPGHPAPEAPDFIYSGLDFDRFRAGYKPWPEEKPCLLKRL
jgi:hypothetical protein